MNIDREDLAKIILEILSKAFTEAGKKIGEIRARDFMGVLEGLPETDADEKTGGGIDEFLSSLSRDLDDRDF